MFIYIWDFKVDPQRIAEFERAYRPGGPWENLFQMGSGYLKTELLRDSGNPERYLTIDFWTDRESFLSFKSNYADEFSKLDTMCEDFTVQEHHIGDFISR
jgi:heme-degrading monooxygenase HmoA